MALQRLLISGLLDSAADLGLASSGAAARSRLVAAAAEAILAISAPSQVPRLALHVGGPGTAVEHRCLPLCSAF